MNILNWIWTELNWIEWKARFQYVAPHPFDYLYAYCFCARTISVDASLKREKKIHISDCEVNVTTCVTTVARMAHSYQKNFLLTEMISI